MKFVYLFGNGAVGKMTVGQELAKQTGLRLFHNHLTIEPVIEVFGEFDGEVINEVRDVFFRHFAASDRYGMIFTFMWAFDLPGDWNYVEHIRQIFEPYGTEFYYVELVASQEVRLQRNVTENRLKNKASKRDIEASNRRVIEMDRSYRLESREGELPFENYIRIDNSNLSPEETAAKIREYFSL